MKRETKTSSRGKITALVALLLLAWGVLLALPEAVTAGKARVGDGLQQSPMVMRERNVEHFSERTTGADGLHGNEAASLAIARHAHGQDMRQAWATLPRALFTLAAILLLGSGLLAYRARVAGVPPRWMAHLEVTLAAAVGLVLTVFATAMLHRRDVHDRDQAFLLLVASHMEAFEGTLRSINSSGLESLARFYESSERVSSREFLQFTAPLVKNPAVRLCEWVQAVPAADRPRFEAAARAEGLTGFEIWQKDAQGHRVPAAGREVYYPVFQVAPLDGNVEALGYDLGSEPRYRAAFDEASRTGRVTATDLDAPEAASRSQAEMDICRPIFSRGEPKVLLGFALASLRMGELLRSCASDDSVFLQLSLLRAGAPPQLLARSWDAGSAPGGAITVECPILAFGKTFALTAWAGPGFLLVHTSRAAWLSALTGLVLTGAFVTWVRLTLGQREKLERLVREQTLDLRESQESYRSQFEANAAIMLLIDPSHGGIVEANAAAQRFYGYPAERLLAMRITDINTMPPAEAAQIMASVVRDQSRHFEAHHRLADGSVRDVEASVSSIHFSGRTILHAIIYDITERKRAEVAMKKRVELDTCLSLMIHSLLRGMKTGQSFEAPLSVLGSGVKASRVCIFQNDLDPEGSLLMRMVDQWSDGSVVPYPQELRSSGLRYEDGWGELAKTLGRGECYLGDSRLWSEEDRRLPWRDDLKTFLLAPIFVEQVAGRGFWGYLSFVQCDDFRQWDENELEIAKSAADLLGTLITRAEEVQQLHLLGAAVDSAQEAVIITDAMLSSPGPHILFANRAAEKLCGYSKEELLLRSPRIFQGPQTNRDAHHRLKVELPQKILFHAITTNYRKDGTPYVVDWNIAPVCDQAGKITHYVSVQRDITQQQAMEKRLTMSSKMESVGSLAAGIAHEINSPAQFIGDNVQFAYDAICKASGRLREAGTALPPKIAQPLFEEVPFALKDALEGLSRIDKIVKSMREFAHPGEEMGPVDINRCLETSVTVCRNEWKHVATVDFQLDPDLPPILCVRSDVNQVVVNLVVNAAHAIAGQKREGLGRILLSTRVHEGWAELQVEDDGPGVPPEIQEKIFDPFFTTKPVGQGTGQGLFLAQQSIVIKHHGRISITNLPAGGAAFLIQLPLHR